MPPKLQMAYGLGSIILILSIVAVGLRARKRRQHAHALRTKEDTAARLASIQREVGIIVLVGKPADETAYHIGCLESLQKCTEAERYEIVTSLYDLILRKRVIEDGKITDEEIVELDRVRHSLGLSESLAASILARCVEEKVSMVIAEAMTDERVTESEIQAIHETAARLRFKLNLASQGTEWDQYLQFARWEAGHFPSVQTPFPLGRDEVCHYAASCRQIAWRTQKHLVGYHGFSQRIRLTKGSSYRIGNVRPVYASEDVLKVTEEGTLYLTNKRVLFRGMRSSKTIRWSSMLAIEPFEGAIQFERSTGAHILFQIRDVDEVTVMAAALFAHS